MYIEIKSQTILKCVKTLLYYSSINLDASFAYSYSPRVLYTYLYKKINIQDYAAKNGVKYAWLL